MGCLVGQGGTKSEGVVGGENAAGEGGTPSRAKQRLMELLFGWLVNVVSVAFFIICFNHWNDG